MRDCPVAQNQNAMLQTGKDCNLSFAFDTAGYASEGSFFTIFNLVICQVPRSRDLWLVYHRTGMGLHMAGPL